LSGGTRAGMPSQVEHLCFSAKSLSLDLRLYHVDDEQESLSVAVIWLDGRSDMHIQFLDLEGTKC
jgi:hypothetical protein